MFMTCTELARVAGNIKDPGVRHAGATFGYGADQYEYKQFDEEVAMGAVLQRHNRSRLSSRKTHRHTTDGLFTTKLWFPGAIAFWEGYACFRAML